MTVKETIALFENTLEIFELTPEETRCEGEGEYLIRMDPIELYIDIWQPKEPSQWQYYPSETPETVFQVIAPICRYPKPEQFPAFASELLHMNFHLHYAALILNAEEEIAAVKFKRPAAGLTREGIVEPIEAVGFYATHIASYLGRKFNAQQL
jgi:hypothetical protein